MNNKLHFFALLFAAVFFPRFVSAQQSSLAGTVVENGSQSPLAGVTIKVAGANIAVVTDADGKFSLKVNKKPPLTFVLSYTGYQSQEYIIENTVDQLLLELRPDYNILNQVVVTSRRRKEIVQESPIPVSVVTGTKAAEAGAFNVNRLKELVPTVQLYSSNPRNTGLSIRGQGTTFGLTNDGIDPGVGFYVDGVYYARTAAATLDFIDVERIEVLRGPQGTLFGKNTTAGAFNVTTRKPSFTHSANVELSYGNYGYIQAKSSITGPLAKNLAARFSFSGTQRDGTVYNTKTQAYVNDLNNLGGRLQLLFAPSEKTEIILAADATRQRPNGYAQVYAGTAPTLRADYRQFNQIIADLKYTLPSTNTFDRIIDQDTPARSFQDLGGISLNIETDLGNGRLTSTTAWRYWNWNPSNDRDFTGLQALALSQAPSKHQQWSQEVRWAGSFSKKVSAVFGVFAFAQNLKSDPYHTEESGVDTWRFSQNSTSSLWKTPGLFDGFGIHTTSKLNTFSGAVFGQADWAVTKRLHILPGLRANYDKKKVDFDRQTYGGLQTTDAALLKLKAAVYTNQTFNVNTDNTNFSGQLTASYKLKKNINAFVTYSTGYKPVGLNLGGLPSASDGSPRTDLAEIKPERVHHFELAVKTSPTKFSTLNVTAYNTDIKDYQTQVQSPELGVNRGYLANAEKVRVRGVEIEGDIRANKHFQFNASVAYTDGRYVKFTNAPLPLEETGKTENGVQVAFKDISGGELPGLSKWAASTSGEYSTASKLFSQKGDFFIALDAYTRSTFSSNPSPSKYLIVPGYALFNGRIGFRSSEKTSVYFWARNIFDRDYFEQLLPGAGNSGQYAGVLGDPRTFGITIRHNF